MKKIILSSLIALAAVSANAGGYIAGYVMGSEDVDAMVQVTLGYEFQNNIRLEADVLGTSDFGADGFGLNLGVSQVKGLYDFNIMKDLDVFAGLGIAEASMYFEKDANAQDVAGSVILGVSYDITDKFSIEAQYNYVYSWARVWLDGVGSNSTDSDTNVWKVGVAYKF